MAGLVRISRDSLTTSTQRAAWALKIDFYILSERILKMKNDFIDAGACEVMEEVEHLRDSIKRRITALPPQPRDFSEFSAILEQFLIKTQENGWKLNIVTDDDSILLFQDRMREG